MIIAGLCVVAIIVVVAMVGTLVLIERAARRGGTVKSVEVAVRDEESEEFDEEAWISSRAW